MEKKRTYLVHHLVYILSFVLALAITGVTQNFAKASQRIVGYFEVFAPFSKVENGRVTGSHVDELLPLLKEAGLHVEPQIVPWKRAYKKGTVNNNSFVYPVARMPARESEFLWVARLGAICPSVIGLKHRLDPQKSPTDNVKELSIALVRNDYSAINALAAGLVSEQNVLWVADHYSMIDLLLKQKVDLIAGDIFHIELMTDYFQLPKAGLVSIINMSNANSDLYLAANPQIDVALLNKLESALTKAIARPEGLLQSGRQCSD